MTAPHPYQEAPCPPRMLAGPVAPGPMKHPLKQDYIYLGSSRPGTRHRPTGGPLGLLLCQTPSTESLVWLPSWPLTPGAPAVSQPKSLEGNMCKGPSLRPCGGELCGLRISGLPPRTLSWPCAAPHSVNICFSPGCKQPSICLKG